MGTKHATEHALEMKRLHPLLFGALLIASTGCEATGTGWIPSAVDITQKATFGFVFAEVLAEDETTYSISGAYHDKAAGVDFKGTGVLKERGPQSGMRINGVCLTGTPAYVSTNQDFPGEGILELTVCDGRSGFVSADFIMLTVLTGPYGVIGPFAPGYANEGFPSGNITVSCKTDDCA